MGLVMASLCFGGTYLSVLAVDHLTRTQSHDIVVARWTSVSFLLLVILFTTSFYLWMNSSVILHEFDWFSWWQDQVTVRIIPAHRGEDSQNEMSGSECDDDDDDDQNRTESSRDITLREMTTSTGGLHYKTTELSLLQKSSQDV
uniref:Uncharacterized protein n=1 Tax=Timema bartmani TaxID=61472 RepID=A0A7R9EMW3_9NEOP|nr:unnamed protein product [Timema bartmani]